MGQQIIIPGRGEITQQDILPADLIAYYKFEETEDLSVAIDWAMNFNGKTPLTHFNQSSRQPGYLGNGLVCNKTARDNFSINMLLDEIPSSLEMSIQFYIKFLEEIKKGEHGTYTLFSKQWATGMRWYCYLISRLESVQLHNVLSYVVADEECASVQVSGASWGDILANGLYYKRSEILYSHSIYDDWRIYYNGSNWLIQKLTGEGEEAEWITHFKSSGVVVQGDYSVEGVGQGNVSVLGVSEVSDTIQIDNMVIMTDKWYKIDLLLKLRENLPSSFGIYFGDDYSATSLTSKVIDIPINTEISPQLVGGDLSDVRFCENDNTIPYIVDGFPFPSSYRYGISGIIDEVMVYRAIQRELPILRPFTLNISIAGYGSVEKEPDKTGYNWGEEVELTASPDPGNSFLKWAGDIDTTENPTTIIMTKDTNITAIFTGKVATPIFNPSGGLYYDEQVVSISCMTEGATIRYTTDGSTPSETSPIYTEPLNITETTTLKARAFLDGWNDSDIATAIYTLKVKTPIFNPLPGTYSGSVDVEIICQTTGAIKRYTLDGTDPTEASPEYISPIHITETKTLKSRAWKENWTKSDCKTGLYTISHWARKSDFPGTGISLSTSVGTKGYVLYNDKSFYEYNQSTNIWSRKADINTSITGIVLGNNLYGYNGNVYYFSYLLTPYYNLSAYNLFANIYKYEISSNEWKPPVYCGCELFLNREYLLDCKFAKSGYGCYMIKHGGNIPYAIIGFGVSGECGGFLYSDYEQLGWAEHYKNFVLGSNCYVMKDNGTIYRWDTYGGVEYLGTTPFGSYFPDLCISDENSNKAFMIQGQHCWTYVENTFTQVDDFPGATPITGFIINNKVYILDSNKALWEYAG